MLGGVTTSKHCYDESIAAALFTPSDTSTTEDQEDVANYHLQECSPISHYRNLSLSLPNAWRYTIVPIFRGENIIFILPWDAQGFPESPNSALS